MASQLLFFITRFFSNYYKDIGYAMYSNIQWQLEAIRLSRYSALTKERFYSYLRDDMALENPDDEEAVVEWGCRFAGNISFMWDITELHYIRRAIYIGVTKCTKLRIWILISKTSKGRSTVKSNIN